MFFWRGISERSLPFGADFSPPPPGGGAAGDADVVEEEAPQRLIDGGGHPVARVVGRGEVAAMPPRFWGGRYWVWVCVSAPLAPARPGFGNTENFQGDNIDGWADSLPPKKHGREEFKGEM